MPVKRQVVIDAEGLRGDNEHVEIVLEGLENINDTSPLDLFKFQDLGGNVYRYEWRLVDGRIWRQTMTFTAGASDSDPLMDWPSDSFKRSEFKAHRAVRNACVELRNSHQIALFRVTWEPY